MRLDEIVAALGARNRDIHAAALFDSEGLPIASSLTEGVDDEKVSAVAAALLSEGESLVKELEQGALNLAIFRASDGITVLARCGDALIFAALASPRARLGLLLVDVSRAAEAVRQSVG